MRWEADVSRGAWLVERLDARRGDMHVAVPLGFEAYARVFHPVGADRPIETTWADVSRNGPFATAGVEHRTATWSEVAAATGATVHPLMQWRAIVRRASAGPNHVGGFVGPSGWRYDDPLEGTPGRALVAALASVLIRHTTTPERGVAAVWEGFGHLFTKPVRLSFTSTTGAASSEDMDEWEPPPPPLGPEVRDGPRFSLPWRDHVLFDAGITEFATPDWPERAPWVSDPWRDGPTILWPDDRAWVVVSEIDWDSTVVAGSRAAIDAVLAASGLEALEIAEGADLTSRGDTVNTAELGDH